MYNLTFNEARLALFKRKTIERENNPIQIRFDKGILKARFRWDGGWEDWRDACMPHGYLNEQSKWRIVEDEDTTE